MEPNPYNPKPGDRHLILERESDSVLKAHANAFRKYEEKGEVGQVIDRVLYGHVIDMGEEAQRILEERKRRCQV